MSFACAAESPRPVEKQSVLKAITVFRGEPDSKLGQDEFLGGRKIKLQSELIMFPNGNYYLKIRATYAAALADRARDEIDFFVRNLKLP